MCQEHSFFVKIVYKTPEAQVKKLLIRRKTSLLAFGTWA